MTDKQIIIDGVDVSGCRQYMHRHMEDYDIDILDYCRYHFKPCKDVDVKYCYYKQLKRKEQEYEELRQYHNKCCIDFENEKQKLLGKYNQVSRDFYNGKYCNKENCSLLKAKEKEREELNERTASIIYSLTGGRLSYSTYTLEGCEQAYHDQLEIDVERATKELQEELQAKEQECEELKKIIQRHDNDNNALLKEVEDKLCEYYRRYKECLTEIIRFFKEDEKFSRYSGRPIIFVKPALEKIEKILKENDIKIS